MKYIAIAAAVPSESDVILSHLKNVRKAMIAGRVLFRGTVSGTDVFLMLTGIGKVNAAHSATALIERYPVGTMINIGIGGAYPASGLAIGDMAVATKEIYGDEGIISARGWKGMSETGLPLLLTGGKKRYNELPLDGVLARKCMKSVLQVGKAKTGTFITVSGVSGTRERALELEKRFHAVCENMEGAAVAHICAIYGVRFLEIRGISNIAGVRDKRRWKPQLAAETCQNALLHLIKKI